MERKIIETGDGSKTIQLVEWNEQYHSIHGALQEAKHVFISYLETYLSDHDQVSIFEMGLGTGLNAGMSAILAQDCKKRIHYTSLEAYPITVEELTALEYDLKLDKGEIFKMIHQAEWEQEVLVHPHFQLKKINQSLENFDSKEAFADMVFYDAFGPRVQPHLWTVPMFEKIYQLMKSGGIFLTYCSKGQVRRDLESVGFQMSKAPGPPGKREMLVGRKN